MLSVNYVRRVLRSLILLMWLPMPVWAAAVMVDSGPGDFAKVSWGVVALAFGLSTLSGATALVWRLDKELRATPDGKLPRLWLFVASNIMGSWLAGVLAWLLSMGIDRDVWTTLSIVILLSFGGARVVETMSEKYLNKAEALP